MLTIALTVLLVSLGGLVGGGTGDQLVSPVGFVLLVHAAGLVVVVGLGRKGVLCSRSVSVAERRGLKLVKEALES